MRLWLCGCLLGTGANTPDDMQPSPNIGGLEGQLPDGFSLLRAIIDAVPDPIFCKDSEGRFLLTNRASNEMFETSGDEFVGKTVFDVPGLREHAHLYHADDMQVIRTGEPVIDREEPFELPDGRKGWYLTSKFPMRDAHGAIVGIVGIARDITARRRAERDLAHERQRLRALLDAVPDPLFFKDLAGRHTLFNAATAKLHHRGPEDYQDKTVFDLPIPRELAELYARDDAQVIATGVPIVNREEPFMLADGGTGCFLTSKYPTREPDGRITGLVGICRDITARKDAERKLAAERELLHTVLNGIADPIFFKDCESRFLLQNDAYRRFFNPQHLPYHGRSDLDFPGLREHADGYRVDDLAVVTSGQPVINREEPFTTPAGRQGWFLTCKFPMRNPAGTVVGLVGICRDITERKVVERQLNDERTLLRTLIDAIPDLIFFKDREGRHVHVNAADRALFGITDDQYLGKTVYEWPIPKDIADQYAADDRRVLETGEPMVNREEPFEGADGTRGWFLTSKLPLRNTAGEITGLIGIARDITQLKHDREELERARQRLIDHVENSPLAVIEWMPDFRIARWAGQAAAIFGWAPEDVVGRHFGDWPFVHPEDAAHVREIGQRLLDGRDQRNVSHNRNLAKSGAVLHCTWQNSALCDADGRLLSVLSLVQDVTERAALDRKLQETQKLESLGVLAGGIAHDFNNLLTGVLGNASLAANDLPADSPIQEFILQIESAATRAADLCRQMLAYSGRGRFVVRRLDLNTLIAETTNLLRVSISKSAALTLDLASSLPAVLADETQMQQIVMNLVINASEALGEHAGAVHVSTGVVRVDRAWIARAHLASDLPDGEYVFLEVADTGSGMTPEVQARIFDPFFTTKFTGRGLGLAAVLGIVRGHHGAIRLQSAPGQGTTLQVLLPRADGPAEPATAGAADAGTWHGAGRVLVVDDEKTVRQIAARLLEALGFEVQLAVDGEDGIAQFAAAPDSFRAVLLDLTMPRMDGEKTFRELRVCRPGICVLMMSGFSEQEIATRFAGSGLAGFLQKPFKLDDLREQLRRALGD